MRTLIVMIMLCSAIGSALAFYPRGTLQFACSMSLLGVSGIFVVSITAMLLARARRDAIMRLRRASFVPQTYIIFHDTIQ